MDAYEEHKWKKFLEALVKIKEAVGYKMDAYEIKLREQQEWKDFLKKAARPLCQECEWLEVQQLDSALCCLACAGEEIENIPQNECPAVHDSFESNRYSEKCLTCECLDIHSVDGFSCEDDTCCHNMFEE